MSQSVLIIEDDVAARLSMVTWLRGAGFHVTQAIDALEGMDAFLQDTPDLVLLDLGIAGEGGMGLLRRMKAVHPAVPVIIVSGRTHISDAIDAFKAVHSRKAVLKHCFR